MENNEEMNKKFEELTKGKDVNKIICFVTEQLTKLTTREIYSILISVLSTNIVTGLLTEEQLKELVENAKEEREK